GADPATPSLTYTPDPRAAFDAVRAGKAAAAVLLNPTKVDEVFAVADAGEVMPPKSTYFVPKVSSGLVLRPLAWRRGPGTRRSGNGGGFWTISGGGRLRNQAWLMGLAVLGLLVGQVWTAAPR